MLSADLIASPPLQGSPVKRNSPTVGGGALPSAAAAWSGLAGAGHSAHTSAWEHLQGQNARWRQRNAHSPALLQVKFGTSTRDKDAKVFISVEHEKGSFGTCRWGGGGPAVCGAGSL